MPTSQPHPTHVRSLIYGAIDRLERRHNLLKLRDKVAGVCNSTARPEAEADSQLCFEFLAEIKPPVVIELGATSELGPSDDKSTAFPRSRRRFDSSLSLAAFALAARVALERRIPTGVISPGLTGVTAVLWLLLRGTAAEEKYCRRLCFSHEINAVLCSKAGRLAGGPLFVEHKAALSLEGLVYRIRRQKRLHDVQLIVVADAQLLKVATQSRLPSEIVQERLTRLSSELEVCIVLFETDVPDEQGCGLAR